jgi:hypothetical protein
VKNQPDLLVEIEVCREKMIQIANTTSYSNKRVVDLSVKLDGLLNKYYQISKSEAPV